jgi:G3E family GTPase
MSEAMHTVANDANAIPTGDAAAGESAQKDTEEVSELDELLKEWDQHSGEQAVEAAEPEKAETETEQSDIKSKLSDLVNWVESQKKAIEKAEEEQFRKQVETELSETIKSIKGDLPIPEKMVKSYVIERAREDERIARAWQNRGKKPQEWAKIEKALKSEIAKELQVKEDVKVTQARQQIAGAIQMSQSSSNGDAGGKKLSEMSDQEFEQHKQRFINS